MVNNPRYPHICTVKRDVFTGTNSKPVKSELVVLTSECRFYPDNSGSEKAGVSTADYKISLPAVSVKLEIGDKVDCSDSLRTISGIITQWHNGNLGCNIWFDIIKN